MKHLLILLTFGLNSFTYISLIESQLLEISGIVLDDVGYPLIGASIIEKGTHNGTVTDIDGTFKLFVKDENSILMVSYTGFHNTEVKVNGKSEIKIKMSSSTPLLDEVIVTGFSKKSKKYHSRTLHSMVSGSMNYSQPFMPSSQETHANWNTEDYDYISENKYFNPKNTPLSTFSIDVDAASYSNMRRFIQNGQEPPKDAIRIEEMVNYFSYDYPQPEGDLPFSVTTELSKCPWNREYQLLHIGLQGKKLETSELPPSNLVFLIDVSGSMDDNNKLPLVISSFKLLIDQMRDEDRVAIVVYAGAAGVVLPSTSGANKDKILNALEGLRAGGSTAGAKGIKRAYKIARSNFIQNGNNRVILATDGDFNVGMSSDGDLVRLIEQERESGVFLTVLGFGMGNYKDSKMQKLADHGNGNHGYIDNIMEAKKMFINEFGGTLFTIAKDVKLQLEFNPINVKEYRLIGYENRVLDKEDFTNDKKDAGEIGAGDTVTALYEIVPNSSNTEGISSVDELRYQETAAVKNRNLNDELLFLKIRYKAPGESKSKLISKSISNEAIDLSKTSDNFKWSAAVAQFGLLLRDSEFKANASYKNVMELAMESDDIDEYGYRDEFVRLVESRNLLASK